METLKIQAEDEEQLKTVKAILKALKVPFEVSKESPYDPEFVAKIKESDVFGSIIKIRSCLRH